MIPISPHQTQLDHISVCICTYKRPQLLSRLLNELLAQVTNSLFTFELVVVDNDVARSAYHIIQDYREKGVLKIVYDCEPEQNIALARNRTVLNASGNYIATIDDDEFPDATWLQRMYICMKEFNADGVLGPVLPHFPNGAPEWLEKSGLCERPRNSTGSPAQSKDLRTGNALFLRSVFEKNAMWFDPERGQGSEDGEFMTRQIGQGRRIVWCDNAIVHETVPEERWSAAYYIRRFFNIGMLAGGRHRRQNKMAAVLKSFLLLFCYSGLLPFSLLVGKHISVMVLTKISYSAGSLLAFFNLCHGSQGK